MTNGTTQLSQEDIKLYDRQIRLWGAESQLKIKNSKIHITDNDRALTAEIVKNLRLSGCENINVSTEYEDDSVELLIISGPLSDPISTNTAVIYTVCNGADGAVSTIPAGFGNLSSRLQAVDETVNVSKTVPSIPFQPTISIIAAVCTQEAIKCITGQHAPIENTFVINSLTFQSSVKKL